MCSLTEFILLSQIKIDFDFEYEAYLHELESDSDHQAARVEITLRPTALLIQMANIIRRIEGFSSINVEDYCDGCQKEKAYWFTCDLNEDDPTKVDPFILIEVCDPDAEDYEGLYTIDLSVDEQKSMYRIFDRQLKTVGKTCACLLQEAWE